jgi:hypothetical protein
VHILQHRWKAQPVVWIAVGLILIAATVLWILWSRPDARAYRDAVLVLGRVAAV